MRTPEIGQRIDRQRMKIVLLPGMDGTGKLFEPLLPFLDKERVTVVSYPTEGEQSYERLAEYVKASLPEEDYILVAESFSGSLGEIIARDGSPHLKVIIFVATFLTTPRRYLIKVIRQLPLKMLSKLPVASVIYRMFLFGAHSDERLISQFQEVLSELPEAIIKRRLMAIDSLKPTTGTIEIPAVYIRAGEDQLVGYEKCTEFREVFSNFSVETIPGPHFYFRHAQKSVLKL